MLLVQFKVMWIFSRHLHMQRPVPPKICADYHSICSMYTVWEVFCLKYVPQIIVGYQKSSRHIRFWPHAIYCMSLPQVSSMSSACYQGFFGGEFFLTLKRLAHWFGSHYKRWTQREPGLLSLLLLAPVAPGDLIPALWWCLKQHPSVSYYTVASSCNYRAMCLQLIQQPPPALHTESWMTER